MSSELRTEFNHKRSTNFTEILEICLIELTTTLAMAETLYTHICVYNVFGCNTTQEKRVAL